MRGRSVVSAWAGCEGRCLTENKKSRQRKVPTGHQGGGTVCITPSNQDWLSGTDATHAEHIETIKARMYVGLTPDKRFLPGHLGMGLVEGKEEELAGVLAEPRN